ncbi:helix-turn-helix domain-containing protein [Salinicola peritrichatus]|uniref:helix-turn-helix domain-containing protein n=1 Tax=Salinicola peritrichatus TaxID=1267424 RepID=UPI000DA1E2E6|nr:helix-turn-helix domain-containing protein [Salinicola peritrichatus]
MNSIQSPLVDLLTPEDAAQHLGVSAHTLATWRSTGRHALPYVKVGARVRYRRTDLDAWLNSRMHEHTGQSWEARP